MTLSNPSRRQLSPLLTLIVGLAVGWSMNAIRTPALRAQGGDRAGEDILATGPVYTRYNEGTKVPISHDAIYFLDWRAGKLIATIPAAPVLKPGVKSKFIENFKERDLVRDFNLKEGDQPHFLMTTSANGYGSSQSIGGDGSSVLVVFESTTKQAAVYKAEPGNYGPNSQIKLELVQVCPYAQPHSTSP